MRLILDGAAVDFIPGSQSMENANWHAMRNPRQTPEEAAREWAKYVQSKLATFEKEDLVLALHAIQNRYSPAHEGFQIWWGPEMTHWSDELKHIFQQGPWRVSGIRKSAKILMGVIKNGIINLKAGAKEKNRRGFW